MRLGGKIFGQWNSPGEWVRLHAQFGYGAAYCPLDADASADDVRAFAEAARKAGLIIAEVGAWSNPLSPNDDQRREAMQKCMGALDLADRIGAVCCVNIVGSRGDKWDGPCAMDLTDETFDMIVQSVREIIDSVRPSRTFYTLETMPWMFPDSTDSYERLLQAIDRPALGVHFDPVNLVNSPATYFKNGDMIREFVQRLGGRIRSCHAKDILLGDRLTVHLDEVPPGKGGLDYETFLMSIDSLGADLPVMIEHLPNDPEVWTSAADHIRSCADPCGISLRQAEIVE